MTKKKSTKAKSVKKKTAVAEKKVPVAEKQVETKAPVKVVVSANKKKKKTSNKFR